MFTPDKEQFHEKANKGNLIPVYREILADMETPVSAFKKIADDRHAFLLESVEHGDNIGRYSFLGANPQVIFSSKGHNIEISYASGRKESFSDPMPLDRLRDLMSNYRPVMDPNLPPFCGGAVGYISYDEVRNLESIGDHLNDDMGVPDIYFMITDTLLIFDHLYHRMTILVNAHIDDRSSPDEAYDEAVRKVNTLHQRLLRPVPHAEPTLTCHAGSVCSNMTQPQYEDMVTRGKEFIMAGDAFQIVLSQRFQIPLGSHPFDVYRALRTVNPSPYMYFLKFDDLNIAGSSPEILVKVSDRQVQIRPIAGTRRRGASRQEDLQLEAELLSDPKERAEHIMLVDLGRNDCGRVCDPGSVRVDDLMTIERYSHVMHIVSNVTGHLRDGLDAFDVFKASFPAGTVSGAPKVRAMQIINELEPVSRGPYAGSVGYFSFNGNLDACITIRTIVMKGDMAYIQAGAGIVADSVPDLEFKETTNKARAMMRAVEMAETGLE